MVHKNKKDVKLIISPSYKKKNNKTTEDRINDLFIKLIEENNPEYALGILESIKMAYTLADWNKVNKAV